MFKVSSILRLCVVVVAMVFSFLWFSVSDSFTGIPLYANSVLVSFIAILLIFGVQFENHFFRELEMGNGNRARTLCILIVLETAGLMFWYDKFLTDAVVGSYLDSIWLKYGLYDKCNRENTISILIFIADIITLVSSIVYFFKIHSLSGGKATR